MALADRDMKLIHELEHKFGSIGDVPEDNPKLKQLRKHLGGTERKKPQHSAVWYSNRKMVKHLYEKTGSAKDVSELSGLSRESVNMMLREIRRGKADKKEEPKDGRRV